MQMMLFVSALKLVQVRPDSSWGFKIPYLMLLTAEGVHTIGLLLFWWSSLPQNNPEHDAGISIEVFESLIKPTVFPE